MINPDSPDYSNHPASSRRRTHSYASLLVPPPVTVSILTPFFNIGDIFLETFRSVLRQSLQEWEWIIVDDGSFDTRALEILEQVESEDSRVRVSRQSNQGPGAARNKAFGSARGRYICLLDGDDLLEPTYLEKAVWFLESQPDFAFCNSWSVVFGQDEFLSSTGLEWGKAHVKANSGPPHSVIRREAYALAGGFDEDIRFGHEDWDFRLALANAGFWGYTIKEYLQWYRRADTGRFTQILKSPGTHKKFERFIRGKYRHLEGNFPSPRLRPGKPYESVSSDIPFDNKLEFDEGGRRILFLIPWMVTGGADRVNLDWMSCLAGKGYEISICATLKARHEWLFEFATITPDIFILPNFLHPADFPRFIAYFIRSRVIDTVVLSGSTVAYQLLPYLRTFCPGVSYVDISHVEEPQWLNGGHPRFGVGYQDLLDLNIVTTHNLRQWMEGIGADRERIEVCYTGVALETLDKHLANRHRMREKLGIAADSPLLIYSGRICEQKRPDVLAEVLRGLANDGIAFHCIVVGDGELMPLLKKRIRQFRLKRSVTLLGTIPHHEWLDALAASDVFFLPSLYEGISVALYEAMAMKVVPVMSAVGGQPEVVTPDCGVLIPLGEGEIEGYTNALKNLIGNPDQRHSMAEAGYHRVARHFNRNESCKSLVEALERARQRANSRLEPQFTHGLATEFATLAVEYARLTTPEILPARLTRLLAWIRTYEMGRRLLGSPVIRIVGRRILSMFPGINR